MPLNSVTQLAARSAWDSGKDLDAGQLIFESLTTDEQVAWAEGVLRACVTRGHSIPEIDQVLALVQDQSAWKAGHEAFRAVRKLTLIVEASPERVDSALHHLLLIAELVAKVAYNATQPIDPFDEDSGWWLAPSVRGFLSTVRSPATTEPSILASLVLSGAIAA
jgi:hypothetical protein